MEICSSISVSQPIKDYGTLTNLAKEKKSIKNEKSIVITYFGQIFKKSFMAQVKA